MQQLHLPEKQKVYTVYLFIMQKAINPCTPKKYLHEKLVKIGKDLTAKSEIGKAKEATRSLIAKCTAKDQYKT